MAVRRKHVRSLVDQLLEQHGISGPPVPVETIVEALGLEVRRAPAEGDLSGFLYRDRQEKTAAIGVNSTHPTSRQRFTLGHELGHYLLHDRDGIHVDRRFNIKLRNAKSSQGTDDEEKEANLFAAELLMPERMLKAELAVIEQLDLEDEASLVRLAEKYAVSVQALSFRVANLGLVMI
jgi:Zn-dependent peptidase ImmA (M78 family)